MKFSCITLSLSMQLVVLYVLLAVPRFADATVFDVPADDVLALIDAINVANDEGANPGPDMINLEATYSLTNPDNTINGPTGLPSITSNITINGRAIIERSSAPGTPEFRIFHVAESGNLTLNNIVVTGGFVRIFDAPNVPFFQQGGGILNDGGTLSIANFSFIADNRSTEGGGIFNIGGTVSIASSFFVRNTDSVLDIGRGSGGGAIGSVGGTVTITDSVIRNNESSGEGVIRNRGTGTLTITDSAVEENFGTGVSNGFRCTLTITNTELRNNIFGILNFGGTANLTNSSISGGEGGILNSGTDQTGTFTIINSTISTTDGTGVLTDSGEASAVTNLNNATITANARGLAFATFGPVFVNISNTIIAQNSGTDCANPVSLPQQVDIRSGGFNLIGNNHGCEGFVAQGDQVGSSGNEIDAVLGPLQDLGTEAHAPLVGSPAIDMGNPAEPGSGDNACEPIDQRGFLRPADGDGGGNAICDIGAFEVNARLPVAALSTEITDSPDPVFIGNDLNYTVTIRNDGPDTAFGVTLEIVLSPEVTFVSASGDGDCAETDGTVSCNFGNLGRSTSEVDIVVRPTARTFRIVAAIARVLSQTIERDFQNNVALEITSVQ